MTDRTSLENLINRTALRAEQDPDKVSLIVEAFLDEIYSSLPL